MKDVKKILTIPENEVELSEFALKIDTRLENPLVREITKALKDTMEEYNLECLSAPQIGYNRRIFCIKFSDSEVKTFINPVMVPAEGIRLSRETSPSVPDKEYIVPRNEKVSLIYQRPTGQVEERDVIGRTALVVQQLVQQLDGITIADLGMEIDEDFDNATEEEREEVIKAYLDSIDMLTKSLNTEIENDKDLKEISDGINFMSSVYKGETIIEGFNDKPAEEKLN